MNYTAEDDHRVQQWLAEKQNLKSNYMVTEYHKIPTRQTNQRGSERTTRKNLKRSLLAGESNSTIANMFAFHNAYTEQFEIILS